MNTLNYKHFLPWEKDNLEKLLNGKPFAKRIYGISAEGIYEVVEYKFCVDIKYLALLLKRDRKTIKNELLRGSYLQLSSDVSKETNWLCYSKGASDHHHKKIIAKRAKQNIKILENKKLGDWIKKELANKQSLKAIGGRSKIEFGAHNIEDSISSKTLYNYINNPEVSFITQSCLKRERKYYYRTKYKGKRQNGKSIDERPENINNRSEFGHWEIDLIEGKRGTKKCLLTMSERKTRKGIAVIIPSKEKQEIVKAIRTMQMKETLIFNKNIKSISTDNGSEFWAWMDFRKSIVNEHDNIDVYFCHPYSSYEKGSVENFNGLIRQYYPKGTNFSEIKQKDIDASIDKINNIYRPILGFITANEAYNKYIQN